MKRILVLILIVTMFAISCSSKTCTSGRVLERYINDNKYYVVIDVTENFKFIGKQKTFEVGSGFWHNASEGHGVTICR